MALEKFPLGKMLIERGVITNEHLDAALRRQKEKGGLLGAILIELGFVTEEKIFLPVLAGQMGVDFISLKDMDIPPVVIAKVPAKCAMYYKIIPYDLKDDVLHIATTEPLDVAFLDEIQLVLNTKLSAHLSSEKDIAEHIRKYYGVGAETIEQMMGTVQAAEEVDNESILQEIDSEASIGKFINQIIIEAYREHATDVHIEPFEDELKVRYRIDGLLKDAKVPSNLKIFKEAINSRIKILSNLNIAEKRIPQDGRFKVRVKEVDIDLRVSFIPAIYGESVVLRLLNTSRLFQLKDLGLGDKELAILEDLILKPHGVVFLTGPTGSGKTTTLYSCLARVNTEDKKIITIEDPVEYQLKGIIQLQVNPRVGLTFAQGLRSCLRHDPDIMMVGEVRDLETAQIAIQSALTGHLIFSTLHTNDAIGGIARLMDMGVEPYLITSTVECFIAQRLVRVLCPQCKKPAKVSADMVSELGSSASLVQTVYEPLGCEACHHTGYSGRIPIYEFLLMTDDIRALIMKEASSVIIRDKALANGMKTLWDVGLEKVKAGITSLSEVVRVVKDEGAEKNVTM
ncbi:MAG: Flp pilus assembly complex ATPase component TadA [Candidatus Omnitrophica bacterium]|nr:Flp pilus assembly complex ATPase component TadA [Candidatus Omnitrophota bacterium]